MPFYEVIANIPKSFCVEAKDEAEAEDLVLDATLGDGDSDPEIESVDDLDETTDAEIIEQFKSEGKLLKAKA